MLGSGLKISKGWPAPAKVNRFLRILGRRGDGYHRLQTAFQFLDVCDQLDFEVLEQPIIERTQAVDGVAAESDLCLRAAKLLQTVSAIPLGVRVTLHKRLPIGGGIGGGSSNAATTLVALNHLWQLDYSVQQLCNLALKLGADVPVFVRGKASWAEGVGETFQPLVAVEHWVAVLVPSVMVSTAGVFNHPKLKRDSTPLRIAPPDELEQQISKAGNDCEAVVVAEYPAVDEALQYLHREVGNGYLSGTGACVFALLPNKASAQKVVANAPVDGFVSRLSNSSILLDQLKNLGV